MWSKSFIEAKGIKINSQVFYIWKSMWSIRNSVTNNYSIFFVS